MNKKITIILLTLISGNCVQIVGMHTLVKKITQKKPLSKRIIIHKNHTILTDNITKEYTAFNGTITEISNKNIRGGEVIYTSPSSEQRNHDISFQATVDIAGPTSFINQNSNTQNDYAKRMDMLLSYTTLHCNSTCTVLHNPCKHVKTYPHPLISNGTIPYTTWHGGLLKPILKKYHIKATDTSLENRSMIRVHLEGVVATDGLATLNLNTTQYDTAYEKDYTVYPSSLELAILGYLKERYIDKQISANTDYYFQDEHGNDSYAKKFKKCIEMEWSSYQYPGDIGTRTEEYTDLIKRYFPRNIYWSSTLISPRNIRTGYKIMHCNIFNSPKNHDDAYMNMTFNVKVNIA